MDLSHFMLPALQHLFLTNGFIHGSKTIYRIRALRSRLAYSSIDVSWSQLPIHIQPIANEEFLLNIVTSFFVQPLFLASMMTYSIFATWEIIFLDLRFVYIYSVAARQPLQQQTFKQINQTFHEICQYKN